MRLECTTQRIALYLQTNLSKIDKINHNQCVHLLVKLKSFRQCEHGTTVLARNFDCEGPKMEKSCDVSLVT